MSQLVMLSGVLASKPESSTTDGRPVTNFRVNVPAENKSLLWHGRTYSNEVSRILHGLEIGAPVSVAGLFHIHVSYEPKLKFRFEVEARQVLVLRPIAPLRQEAAK
jgi:hypothetical protein